MQEHEIELSIGETIQVGQHFITILQVEKGIVKLQIEHETDVREFRFSGFDEIDESLRR